MCREIVDYMGTDGIVCMWLSAVSRVDEGDTSPSTLQQCGNAYVSWPASTYVCLRQRNIIGAGYLTVCPIPMMSRPRFGIY